MPKRRKRHNGPTPPKVYGFVSLEDVAEVGQRDAETAAAAAEILSAGWLTPTVIAGETVGYTMTRPRPRRTAGAR